MFEDVLARIEAMLDVPYPQRSQLVRELDADLCACYGALREQGASEEEARDRALRELGLDEEALASLSALHAPIIRRLLLRLPQPAREPAEWLAAGSSLIVGLYFIITEVPMREFIHEGGYAMYFILFIGGAALLLQARRAFSWFVSRDHSAASLARNTATPLYLQAAATMVSAISGSAAGFRNVFVYVVKNKAGADVAMMGAYEALAPILLGGTIVFLIILVQAALAVTGLRAMQVKTPVS